MNLKDLAGKGGKPNTNENIFFPNLIPNKTPHQPQIQNIGLSSNYPNAHNASTLNLRGRSRVLLLTKHKFILDHTTFELFPLSRQHSNCVGEEPNRALALGAY